MEAGIVSSIDKQLASSKAVSWRGPGELIQPPWSLSISCLALVLDLWSGFSGAVIALLALGVRVVALAADSNADARHVASQNMPGLIHVEWVESVSSGSIRGLLQRRSVQAIVVGGAALVRVTRP